MHEMSLCESVVQILEQQAAVQQYSRVKAVWLEVGMLANVEPDAMRFCFDAVAEGSLAEGARLELLQIPGQAECLACAAQVVVRQLYGQCPNCGSHRLQVNTGNQLRIKELEVE